MHRIDGPPATTRHRWAARPTRSVDRRLSHGRDHDEAHEQGRLGRPRQQGRRGIPGVLLEPLRLGRQVNPDPQYGGYARAKLGGHEPRGSAGAGPEPPPAWTSTSARRTCDLAQRVPAAGGTVVMPPFTVGDQGQMAVFQDPTGAFISAWQAGAMGGFTRAREHVRLGRAQHPRHRQGDPVLQTVFGWTTTVMPRRRCVPPYTTFYLDGDRASPARCRWTRDASEHPELLDALLRVGRRGRGVRRRPSAHTEMVPPTEFPGGRFAIVSDPQGAMFGLMRFGS